MNKVILGDCLEKLKDLEDNSVDSIVTDPPAGISFMGKGWDSDKGGRDNWIKWMSDVATECKRVLKPGGHAFVWAIPRTSHWTATAWENAGFEIRDVVAHVFGSGFPKSLNIGKAVDKLQGNEGEVTGSYKVPDIKGDAYGTMNEKQGGSYKNIEVNQTKGTSEWEGWGTALKPAREDWILMRKPLEKGLSIAENCLKWGTGGINIDENRVAHQSEADRLSATPQGKVIRNNFAPGEGVEGTETNRPDTSLGRFPANLIHDNSEEVRECFPEQKSGARKAQGYKEDRNLWNKTGGGDCESSSGNASRFFKSIIYQAKASKSERNKGCEGLEEKPKVFNGQSDKPSTDMKDVEKRFTTLPKANNHPTVKPIALMEYLIKMVTPKGGVVLDPFAGSGSTLVAAKENGFNYIGIELTEEYIPIIQARLNSIETTLFN